MVSTLDSYAGGLQFEFGIRPLLKHACLKPCWLSKRLAGVAPEVNLTGHTSYTPLLSANKAATLALKRRGDVTRSPKQRYQWPHKTDMCSPKIFKPKKKRLPDTGSFPLLSCTAISMHKLFVNEAVNVLPTRLSNQMTSTLY